MSKEEKKFLNVVTKAKGKPVSLTEIMISSGLEIPVIESCLSSLLTQKFLCQGRNEKGLDVWWLPGINIHAETNSLVSHSIAPNASIPISIHVPIPAPSPLPNFVSNQNSETVIMKKVSTPQPSMVSLPKIEKENTDSSKVLILSLSILAILISAWLGRYFSQKDAALKYVTKIEYLKLQKDQDEFQGKAKSKILSLLAEQKQLNEKLDSLLAKPTKLKQERVKAKR